eukprot:2131026-Rhodomonas_salina.1
MDPREVRTPNSHPVIPLLPPHPEVECENVMGPACCTFPMRENVMPASVLNPDTASPRVCDLAEMRFCETANDVRCGDAFLL